MLARKKLDPQMFVYLAVTDADFRQAYLEKEDIHALKRDFDIAPESLDMISKIDLRKLGAELSTVDKNLREVGPLMDTCYDSHSSSHRNTCGQMTREILDPVLAQVMR